MLKIIFTPKNYKYVFSGIVGGATNIGILFLLVNFFHFWYLISSAIAFSTSCVVGFFLRKFWTFSNFSKEHIKSQFVMYSTLLLVGNFLNIILIAFLVEYVSIHYVLAQVFSIFFLAMVNFVVYDKFIFKNKTIS